MRRDSGRVDGDNPLEIGPAGRLESEDYEGVEARKRMNRTKVYFFSLGECIECRRPWVIGNMLWEIRGRETLDRQGRRCLILFGKTVREGTTGIRALRKENDVQHSGRLSQA